jgi:hypothetical protein
MAINGPPMMQPSARSPARRHLRPAAGDDPDKNGEPKGSPKQLLLPELREDPRKSSKNDRSRRT